MTEQIGTQEIPLNPAATSFHLQSPRLQHVPRPTLPITTPNLTSITPELNILVCKMVEEALNKKEKTYEVEKILDPSYITDVDRIPDIVKTLREFKGSAVEYLSRRKNIDRIMEIYGNLRGTAKFFGIITVIRSKITGQANIKLEAHNTPLNWEAMKECLNTHYADKGDINTLEYQLNTLVQGRNTIEEFYQQVFTKLSLILNKLSTSGMDKATAFTFTNSYRNKALDTFIRGLNGDLPQLLAVHEPSDLPHALYMCTKLANQNYRTQFANQKGSNLSNQHSYQQYQTKSQPRLNQQSYQQQQVPFNRQYQQTNYQNTNQQLYPNSAQYY